MIERMVDPILETASKYPNKIALNFMGKKTKYSELSKEIYTASSALISLGVTSNDIISIIMPNMPQAVILIYAANMIGAAVNMIHPLSSQNEVENIINTVQTHTVLVLDQFENLVSGIHIKNVIVTSVKDALGPIKRLFVKRKIIVNDHITWRNFLKTSKNTNIPNLHFDSDRTALILQSGGSTGKAKGVCLSNTAVNTSALQMMEANPMICSDDRFLSVMPIFHGNGLVIGVHSMLMLGAMCVLIPRFTPETYARDLLKWKCNYMSGVPALFERLMSAKVMKNADLSFIKGVFCGADYLSVELEKRLNSFLKEHNCPVPVRQGYGMTEGVVATTLNPVDIQKPGSIGKALPGVEIKIVKPDSEEELPHGEVGEIVFTSKTNMSGYFNNDSETKQTLRIHSDNKTWIHSGDLGIEDNDHFFFFKGRIKRMIVINGYNVFPNEVENIMESFRMIDRCCVLSIPLTEGTSKIVAFVSLNQGFDKTEETKKEIISLCRSKISKYAIPKDIRFIDNMPKTKVGKVDFKKLQEELFV